MSNSPQENSLLGTTLFDRYKIIKKLGKGGFGQTFLAEDIQMPEIEKCVVKKLKFPSSEPQIVKKCEELFKKEALALQKLGKNTSIPELKAYFPDPDQQQFYLVQEYIEGEPLHKVMLNATEDKIIKIIEDVGNTLVEVHNNNIIHRDIKPQNLILRSSNDQVVLIDFGAVKEITTQIIDEQGRMLKTVAIGSREYMAPEQAQGRPCFASDIYSLGIVAIEKLIRKKPYSDKDGNIRWDLPVGVFVSDQLAEILYKMTRFALSERYNNIEEVLADLQAFKDNDSTNILSSLSQNQPAPVTENSSKNLVQQSPGSDVSNSDQSQPTQINHSSSPIKKIFITLPIILLVGIGFRIYNFLTPTPSSKNNTEIKTDKWKTYKDNNNNFEFLYPQDGQLSKDLIIGDVQIVYDQNDKIIHDIVVSVDSLKVNTSLDEYSDFLAKDISNQKAAFTAINSFKQQIANTEGRKIVYLIQDNDVEKQVQIYFTKYNRRIYIIKITTANLNSPLAQEIVNKIIDSFVINN